VAHGRGEMAEPERRRRPVGLASRGQRRKREARGGEEDVGGGGNGDG